jgi:hypothetical protein
MEREDWVSYNGRKGGGDVLAAVSPLLLKSKTCVLTSVFYTVQCLICDRKTDGGIPYKQFLINAKLQIGNKR